MTHGDPKQYGGPRAVTDGRVERLFEHVVGSVHVVEPRAVQLYPKADREHDHGAQVHDDLRNEACRHQRRALVVRT